MFGNGAYEGYTVRLEAAVDKAVSFLVKARYVGAVSGKHWCSIRTGLPGKLAEGPCVHLFFRLGHKGSFLVRDDEGIGAAPVKVLAPRALVSYIVATATEQRSTSPSLLPLEALLESLVKELEGVSLHPPFYLGNA